MTRGVVIFAFNSGKIDYQAMAVWSAERIKRHLGLPTTVVTNSPVDAEILDQVVIVDAEEGGTRYFEDLKTNVTWFNGNRMDVYRLSPYNETLVLDADYVVASDQLNQLFSVSEDFVATRWAYDVTNTRTFEDLNWFGAHKMPMAWATVMRFRRSQVSQNIFNMMAMIKLNWQHYRNLYGIANSTYRNDYALSIALNTLYGHQAKWPSVPWSLASVVPEHSLEQIDADSYKISFVTSENKPRHIIVNGQDFHAMGKKHLGDIVANSK